MTYCAQRNSNTMQPIGDGRLGNGSVHKPNIAPDRSAVELIAVCGWPWRRWTRPSAGWRERPSSWANRPRRKTPRLSSRSCAAHDLWFHSTSQYGSAGFLTSVWNNSHWVKGLGMADGPWVQNHAAIRIFVPREGPRAEQVEGARRLSPCTRHRFLVCHGRLGSDGGTPPRAAGSGEDARPVQTADSK